MSNGEQIICPLCLDSVDKLLYRFHIDGERRVIERLKEHNPSWTEKDGACSRCIDYYHVEIVREQRMLPEIGPYFPVKSVDDFVILPAGLRVGADQRFTGKGVTICFIDSGFYAHPDLVAVKNRIKKYIDITIPETELDIALIEKKLDETGGWHGTMTTVVCAGDGYLSNGLYKGIACGAELLLIKVQDKSGKISTENIVKALNWVLENHEQYNIRIVNMSLGDDELGSYKESKVDIAAEALIEKGVVVVAAVGNDENGAIRPPANSLNVIAVGGVDDENVLNNGIIKAYHSSYGRTADELMKPELTAHAIWIAAPILPCTNEAEEAKLLYYFLNTPDNKIQNEVKKYFKKTGLDKAVNEHNDCNFIKEKIIQRIQHCKFISPHYMHVDGTSFAAPIVCSVIAQLLEANPGLSPQLIREVLFSTAKRIDTIDAIRQGFGIIQPRNAILKVLKREFIMKPHTSPHVNRQKKSIEFYMQSDCASQISLAGSFNNWAQDVLLMEPGNNGIWKIEIPMLPQGRYQYKFFIDDKMWMEDIGNPYREPDGFAGFNSILLIEQEKTN